MANIRHPNFILGIVAMILGMIAIGFRSNREHSTGDILAIASAVLAFISWVWAIFEVQTTNTLQGTQRMFWRIIVVAIPFVGGLLYHLLHGKKGTIVDS